MKKLFALGLLVTSTMSFATGYESENSSKVQQNSYKAPSKIGVLDGISDAIAETIYEVAAGGEQLQTLNDMGKDSDTLNGFVRLKGHMDKHGREKMVPFEIKIVEDGSKDVSLGIMRWGDYTGYREGRVGTIFYKEGADNQKHTRIEAGMYSEETSLFKNSDGSLYLGLYGEISGGFEYYDSGDLNIKVYDEDPDNDHSNDLYGSTPVTAYVNYKAGVTAGIMKGSHKLVASSIYEKNDLTRRVLRTQGLVNKLSYTVDLGSKEEFEIFYQYDGTSAEYTNPITGELFDMNADFRPEHQLQFVWRK